MVSHHFRLTGNRILRYFWLKAKAPGVTLDLFTSGLRQHLMPEVFLCRIILKLVRYLMLKLLPINFNEAVKIFVI